MKTYGLEHIRPAHFGMTPTSVDLIDASELKTKKFRCPSCKFRTDRKIQQFNCPHCGTAMVQCKTQWDRKLERAKKQYQELNPGE